MELKRLLLAPFSRSLLVLIVPFMELKLMGQRHEFYLILCLNRTFYGIETQNREVVAHTEYVLIVPFMELKLFLLHRPQMVISLNRTFYGIETNL